MKRNNKGQFLKGSNGNTYEGFGIWYDKKGYPTIWINNKSIKLHIYVWEKVNGEKPKGYDVHHKDLDNRNYNINNLELLTKSDHSRIHAGWIRHDGKWTHKPCNECRKILPLSKFYKRKGYTPSALCKACHLIQTSIYQNLPSRKEKTRIIKKESYEKNKLLKSI